MTERELARNICECHARTIVDHAGGVTLGGNALAEGYAAMWHGSVNTYECEQALRHWVVAAGYAKSGNFLYVLSKHLINC